MNSFFIKLYIILAYLTNFIFAQSSIDLTPYNLTNTCSATISSLFNNSAITSCLPILTIATSLPVILNFTDDSNPLTKVDLLAQVVKMTCTLPKCSPGTIQPVVDSIKTQCAQDLLANNQAAVPMFELFSYYSVIRDVICLRDSENEYDSFCVLETLVNIGTASNATSSQNLVARRKNPLDDKTDDIPGTISPTPSTATVSSTSSIETDSSRSITSTATSSPMTTPSASSNMTASATSNSPSPTNTDTCPSGSSNNSIIPMLIPLSGLPTSIICTDCNKAMTTVVLKYLKSNPNAFACTPLDPAIPLIQSFLSMKCNATFLDMSTPNSVTSSGYALRYQKIFNDFVNMELICLGVLICGLAFM